MKNIVTISMACAMACAMPSMAQNAPAPAPVAADTAAVSPKADAVAKQAVTLMKDLADVLAGVKDKATADAAAVKVNDINKQGDALQAQNKGLEDEVEAAMSKYQAELLPIFMQLMSNMQRIAGANFFDSNALRDSLQAQMGPDSGGDVVEEEEVEIEVVPAPAPAPAN